MERFYLKEFAENPVIRTGIYGSEAQGKAQYSEDPETIQSGIAWEQGIGSATNEATRQPALNDVQGVLKVLSRAIKNGQVSGIPLWSEKEEYHKGSIVLVITKDGLPILLYSLSDANKGCNPLEDKDNWRKLNLGGEGSKSLGEIVSSILPIEDAGMHLADGSSLVKAGIYREFYEYLLELQRKNSYILQVVNANLVGDVLADDAHTTSNFNATNYLQLPYAFRPKNKTWEIMLKVQLGSNITTVQSIVNKISSSSNDAQLNIVVRNSKVEFNVSYSGTAWVGIKQGTTTLQANAIVFFKLVFDGNNYILSSSTDGENWTIEATLASTTPIFESSNSLILGNAGHALTSEYFRGKIYCAESYIKIDGNYFWQGTRYEEQNNLANLFCSEEEWQSIKTTNGFCPRFVLNNETTPLYAFSLTNEEGEEITYYSATLEEGETKAYSSAFVDRWLEDPNTSEVDENAIYGLVVATEDGRVLIDYVADEETGSVATVVYARNTALDKTIKNLNETFRLPNLNGYAKAITNIADLGAIQMAGLPNITGSFGGTDAFGTSGAFYKTGGTDSGADWRGDYKGRTIGFNASRASSIYGNSSTVDVASSKLLQYICVATSTKTEIEVNIDNVVNDLNRKMALDGSNATFPVIVETYSSSDGNNWYRLYSDGWLEQGGNFQNNSVGQILSFLKPFRDVNYSITASGGSNQFGNIALYDRTTISCACWSSDDTSFNVANVSWMACGYVGE